MTFGNTNRPVISPPAASLVCDTPCELITLELADGYLGAARVFEAADSRRAVVYLHGIQSHGGWFLQSCDFLRGRGMTVLAPDRRGSGLNRRARGHCDSPRQLIKDVNRGVDWLRRRTGFKQVDLVAVSWGGKLALAYAEEFSEKIRSVALVAPGLCPKIDIRLTAKIAIGVHGLLHPRQPHKIPLNEPTLFTQTPALLTFIENDPLKLTHATASFFIASSRLDAKVRKVIGRLKVPVYLFLAGQDRIIENQATIRLLGPVLQPRKEASDPAKIYRRAHHTLDFEPDPLPFFCDLADSLA